MQFMRRRLRENKISKITVSHPQGQGHSKFECATESHKKGINIEQFTSAKMNIISKRKK